MTYEPECTCQQTDVDLFSAANCDLHSPNSAWNVEQRSVGSVEQMDDMGYCGEISADEHRYEASCAASDARAAEYAAEVFDGGWNDRSEA